MSKKIMIETEQGRFFTVEASEVARDRANYYGNKDDDSSYEDEYKFTMPDDYELTNWLQNNMDFYSLETLIETTTIKDISELDIDSCHVFED